MHHGHHNNIYIIHYRCAKFTPNQQSTSSTLVEEDGIIALLGIIANIILCKIPSMKPINSADTNDCDEKDKWKREWKLVAEVLDR